MKINRDTKKQKGLQDIIIKALFTTVGQPAVSPPPQAPNSQEA